jgi:hypothetical protein
MKVIAEPPSDPVRLAAQAFLCALLAVFCLALPAPAAEFLGRETIPEPTST